jgi:2-polyprenyl-3-methyl-5-hydroxy-6-metoxy-1,4-benzoquinol methylase
MEIDYKRRYDQGWKKALEEGREDFGDLELSMLFLKKTGLLEKQHSILEIGCGVGKLCNTLYDMDYHDVSGIDISSSAIAFGKNCYPHLKLHCMDASVLEFPDEHFDICLSFDVVEHLPDINAHFKEVRRILKPKGKYVFETPNILSNAVFETILRKGFAWKVYHPSLQFSWTLKKKLLDAGFAKTEFLKLPPLSKYKIEQVPRFARWLFKSIPWKHLPIFLQTNFYVVAYK